jgi:hypothetical protein
MFFYDAQLFSIQLFLSENIYNSISSVLQFSNAQSFWAPLYLIFETEEIYDFPGLFSPREATYCHFRCTVVYFGHLKHNFRSRQKLILF